MIGAGRGTGVTHLAIWMANYLTAVCHEQTAVLEWNEHGDFARMGHFCTASEHFCRILDAEYYAKAGAEELVRCLNDAYRRIIVDFGEITEAHLRECGRCDRKVIVGALSEWRAAAFLEEAKKKTKRDESWSYAAAFGSEETRKELEKTFRMICLRIPASVDAFAVTRADMKFFERLLK
ncbi:MAG: hypothetical protein ACI39W_02080 [Brotaphodocola sp.]